MSKPSIPSTKNARDAHGGMKIQLFSVVRSQSLPLRQIFQRVTSKDVALFLYPRLGAGLICTPGLYPFALFRVAAQAEHGRLGGRRLALFTGVGFALLFTIHTVFRAKSSPCPVSFVRFAPSATEKRLLGTVPGGRFRIIRQYREVS